MNIYELKQKELKAIAEREAKVIIEGLVLANGGKSILDLRKATLKFINKNNVPEGVSLKVKTMIDEYISNLEIPVQKD